MPTVFADSFYFFALANRKDAAHLKALEFSQTFSGILLTTVFVLTELADGFSNPPHRRTVASQIIEELQNNPNVVVVANSDLLFGEGIRFFADRQDKAWSLTDCISFVVMNQQGITEALTADHHFEQAGFTVLLR
jgi:uncharacterized protein